MHCWIQSSWLTIICSISYLPNLVINRTQLSTISGTGRPVTYWKGSYIEISSGIIVHLLDLIMQEQLPKMHYIITTVKLAIWLVNSRTGSGYPARGIKLPSRDFRGILKMSLFHCSYFIKQLPNGLPSRIAWSMHLGCCSTFGKRKNTLACGSSIFTLSESLATSLVHGSRNPARKTIRYSFKAVFH
jgi:hypothetical protein